MRNVVINPKKRMDYKVACHALMEEIFGTGKEGKKRAYAWFRKQYGHEIHFSQINDQKTLHEIHENLFKESFKTKQYVDNFWD